MSTRTKYLLKSYLESNMVVSFVVKPHCTPALFVQYNYIDNTKIQMFQNTLLSSSHTKFNPNQKT